MNSLYHQDMYNFNEPIKSYWEYSKSNIHVKTTEIENNNTTDIAVIGGGYTGLSCALQLAKKFNYKVSVLEAGHFGFGSSGRNGGFLCIGPTKLSIKQLIKKYGIDEIKKYFQNQLDGSNYTMQLIKDLNIDCDVVGNCNLEVAHHPNFVESIKEYAKELNFFGFKTNFFAKEEFDEIGHTGNEQFGAISYEPGCALHPLKFHLGLANACNKNNVNLFSKCEVLKIEKSNNKFNIITNKGNIISNKIVFAVNGFYKDNFYKKFNDRIIPAISNIIVTRPLSDEELKIHNFVTMNPILNARNLLFYYRLLPDKRILFGARGDLSGSKKSSLKMSKWIEKRFRQVFPGWHKINIDFRWSGFTAITRELTPAIGKIENEEIYHSFGYHANGVNTAPWSGKELANLIGSSNSKNINASKVFHGMPRKFPFPFLRLYYLKLAYMYYSLIDK